MRKFAKKVAIPTLLFFLFTGGVSYADTTPATQTTQTTSSSADTTSNTTLPSSPDQAVKSINPQFHQISPEKVGRNVKSLQVGFYNWLNDNILLFSAIILMLGLGVLVLGSLFGSLKMRVMGWSAVGTSLLAYLIVTNLWDIVGFASSIGNRIFGG